MKYGLRDDAIEKVRGVFAAQPKIRRAFLYGSRAKGNFKYGSDIDLSLEAPDMGFSELLKIENELDDLLLPHKIDLSLIHHIENQNLLDHIHRVGLLFYENPQNG